MKLICDCGHKINIFTGGKYIDNLYIVVCNQCSKEHQIRVLDKNNTPTQTKHHNQLTESEARWLYNKAHRIGNQKEFIEELKAENNIKQSPIDKPPIGLKPKQLHNEERIKEIKSAIERYKGSFYVVPAEWIDELNELSPNKSPIEEAREYYAWIKNGMKVMKDDKKNVGELIIDRQVDLYEKAYNEKDK